MAVVTFMDKVWWGYGVAYILLVLDPSKESLGGTCAEKLLASNTI